jgi:hypothetical protein
MAILLSLPFGELGEPKSIMAFFIDSKITKSPQIGVSEGFCLFMFSIQPFLSEFRRVKVDFD